MHWLAKLVLDYLWGKLWPMFMDWVKGEKRKAEISDEEDEENLAIKEVKKQIEKYQKETGTDEIPPNLEAELRKRARNRSRGL